jgi:hypothetical protein
MLLYIILLIIILILILFRKNIEKYENVQVLTINEHQKTIFNNDKKNIYKVGLSDNITVEQENCFYDCDKTNCIKMFDRKKILNQCLKCNIQKNKCFNKSIIGGNCDDCSIENIEDKLDCYNVNNFGCANPKNINYIEGVDPYYIKLNDNNPSSPYNERCVFCWNILNNI